MCTQTHTCAPSAWTVCQFSDAIEARQHTHAQHNTQVLARAPAHVPSVDLLPQYPARGPTTQARAGQHPPLCMHAHRAHTHTHTHTLTPGVHLLRAPHTRCPFTTHTRCPLTTHTRCPLTTTTSSPYSTATATAGACKSPVLQAQRRTGSCSWCWSTATPRWARPFSQAPSTGVAGRGGGRPQRPSTPKRVYRKRIV